MADETEEFRRGLVAVLNSKKTDRQVLEEWYGEVWDTDELQRDFIVQAFYAPFVIVTRKKDGVHGSLMFQDHPRYYFRFQQK